MTAMPFVKPTTTGRGMNLTAVPKPVAPKTSRMIPANRVHMNNPSMPYFATIPNTTTTKAPVGPPICVEDPPKAEITKPATIAQYRPACGGIPEAIAKAIAKGSATSPTVIPARRSAMNRRGVYDLKHSTDFGNQAPILFDRFSGTDQCQECRFLWRYITPLRPIGRSKVSILAQLNDKRNWMRIAVNQRATAPANREDRALDPVPAQSELPQRETDAEQLRWSLGRFSPLGNCSCSGVQHPRPTFSSNPCSDTPNAGRVLVDVCDARHQSR
jgi:hypothetical protein